LSSDGRREKWWRRLGAPVLVSGSVLMGANVVLALLPLKGTWPSTLIFGTCPIFFAGSIAFVICHHDSVASRVLRARPLRFFGDISYASYLVHLYVLSSYDKIAGPLRSGATGPFLLRGAAVLVVTTIVCTLSLYLFERPVMALRQRFLA
jgi:peptidoglycan/LPS O-acetylase OafA/YrhL